MQFKTETTFGPVLALGHKPAEWLDEVQASASATDAPSAVLQRASAAFLGTNSVAARPCVGR